MGYQFGDGSFFESYVFVVTKLKCMQPNLVATKYTHHVLRLMSA